MPLLNGFTTHFEVCNRTKLKETGWNVWITWSMPSGWLKDWTQEVLPSTFTEKQPDYFGKKGMSVHVDVSFQRNEIGNLTKLVYSTVIFHCDH